MKRSLFLIISLALLQFGLSPINSSAQPAEGDKVVTLAVSHGLDQLTGRWVSEYSAANPGSTINIIPSGEATEADLWICNSSEAGTVAGTDGWKMVVARDIVVPVMSTGSPLSNLIMSRGVSSSEYGMMITSSVTWGEILGSSPSARARVMVTASAAEAVARFTDVDGSLIAAAPQAGGDRILSILKSEPATVIFCTLAEVTAENGTSLAEGIGIIPIDINSNGHSDYFERFYADYHSFNRGVYIGKYPKELTSSIFCAVESRLTTEASANFIGWLVTDGQEYVASSGYTALSGGEGSVRREMLSSDATLVAAESDGRRAGVVAWIAVMIAAVAAVGFLLYRVTHAGAVRHITLPDDQPRAFGPATMATPAGLLFDKSHTWAFMEKNGTITIGIDDFLQYVTGPISRVTMKMAGEKIRKGEAIATLVQRGRKLEVLSPVSGTIVTANGQVATNTSLLHNQPYSEGWLYAVEPENWVNESSLLTMAGKYRDHLREEFSRLRDFLASMAAAGNLKHAALVLQDGGEMKEGILDEFGPEVWEEFQIRFINRS